MRSFSRLLLISLTISLIWNTVILKASIFTLPFSSCLSAFHFETYPSISCPWSVGELQDFPPVVEKEEEEVGKNAEAGGDFYALHNPLLQPLHLSTPRTFTTPTTTSTPFHALQYVCPVLLLPLDLSTSTQPIASCGAGHHCKSNILPLLVESITTSSFKQRIYQYNEAHIYLANNP